MLFRTRSGKLFKRGTFYRRLSCNSFFLLYKCPSREQNIINGVCCYEIFSMKRHAWFLVFVLILIINPLREIKGQNIEYIKVPELEKILKAPENKLFVVNFWATWCAPCVSEIPNFEKVAKTYDPQKVKFILVSLDFPSQIENQLKPFLKKNKITLDVAVMMDVDYNKWISSVDPAWQGDIPATLIFNNSKKSKYFHTGEVTETELKKYINSFL